MYILYCSVWECSKAHYCFALPVQRHFQINTFDSSCVYMLVGDDDVGGVRCSCYYLLYNLLKLIFRLGLAAQLLSMHYTYIPKIDDTRESDLVQRWRSLLPHKFCDWILFAIQLVLSPCVHLVVLIRCQLM